MPATPLPDYALLPEEELVRLHAAAVRPIQYSSQAQVSDALRRLAGIECALYVRRKARVEDVAFEHDWQIHYYNRYGAMFTKAPRIGADKRRIYAVFTLLGTVSYLDADPLGTREPASGRDLTDQLMEALKK